ncbi:MAG TPA: PaaI family thioesterase [Vicinamibacterales bacterium]|nr:PaaI family thioesterase [Vicinamibacterales bacterium]
MTGGHGSESHASGRIAESFGRQTLMALFGATLDRVAKGEVDIRLPYRPDLCQQHGFLHAGVVTAIVDSACGYAALTTMPDGVGVLSVEFKINLLAPAAGDEFIARGRVVRAGRTVTVCTGEVVARQNGAEKPIALMQATMMTVRGRDEVVG